MSVDTIPSFLPTIPYLQVSMPVVRKLLVETTEVLTGYPRGRVIVETLNDRRPVDGSPYCTLWFKRVEPLVMGPGVTFFDPNDTANTEQAIQVFNNESHCTVQFSFWGDSALTEAVQFMQQLHSDMRFADLWQILGYSGVDQIQDISTEYGAKIQQRAYFNLDFYVCLGRALPLDWFNVSQWTITMALVNNSDFTLTIP